MEDEQTQSGTVIIVDDEAIILGPLKRLLQEVFEKEQLNYQILTSQSPREVLGRIERGGSDIAVVISDIKMEPMDGLEFLREVRAKYPDTFLIALSGYIDQKMFNTLTEEIELYSYQKKPWDSEQLERVVKTALDGHRRQKLLYRYAPKEIIKEVLSQPDDSILDGIEVEATILFLDVRDSTRLFHSDNMSSKETLKHLNLYFSELLEVLDNYENGILDKFMGDGIMAVFGVPPLSTNTAANNACDAVMAALEMKDRIHQLNLLYPLNPLRIGIGINTGYVIAGNVGTDKRANYTVLGNDVNTASRLEKSAKSIQDGILISEKTYSYVKDMVSVRFHHYLSINEKQDKLSVYEVLGRSIG